MTPEAFLREANRRWDDGDYRGAYELHQEHLDTVLFNAMTPDQQRRTRAISHLILRAAGGLGFAEPASEHLTPSGRVP